MKVRVEKQFGEGVLSIETGQLAKQAAGSCLVQFGETVVLAALADGPQCVEPGFEVNVFHKCGFAPMHTLLAATTAKSGKLLQYEQGRVDDRKSVVSYASLALY